MPRRAGSPSRGWPTDHIGERRAVHRAAPFVVGQSLARGRRVAGRSEAAGRCVWPKRPDAARCGIDRACGIAGIEDVVVTRRRRAVADLPLVPSIGPFASSASVFKCSCDSVMGPVLDRSARHFVEEDRRLQAGADLSWLPRTVATIEPSARSMHGPGSPPYPRDRRAAASS